MKILIGEKMGNRGRTKHGDVRETLNIFALQQKIFYNKTGGDKRLLTG